MGHYIQDPAFRVDPDESAELVRLHVITLGRSLSGGTQLPLTALIAAVEGAPRPPGRLSPEEEHLLDLCRGGFLAVAEIAGHSQLPLGVVRAFLASLLESGYISIRRPRTDGASPGAQVMRDVLDGLEAKFG
ncbi:DUF742 domain-containing protein [Streptomyces sp. NPDC047072]|uniref:DUF742 domain-containing protein n=1 Tax=Streptomyces sp. NPDC047072 TaxID=3154809 RepID=UPI0033C1A54B